MLFLSIGLFALAGLSLMVLSRLRARTRRRPSPYRAPPPGWPRVDVGDIALFDRIGRINQPINCRRKPHIRRFDSFHAAQDYVIGLVDTRPMRPPQISLRLSDKDGPDWTDVMLDGAVVAHVQTTALTSPRPG